MRFERIIDLKRTVPQERTSREGYNTVADSDKEFHADVMEAEQAAASNVDHDKRKE